MWTYRINEDARIQKFWHGEWVELHPYITGGRQRALVRMRSADNRKIEVPVVWLMADAFMGGRRPGMTITHKDGSKLNCAVWNLQFMTRSECARLGGKSRRRTVLKIAPDGTVVNIYRSAREAAKKEYVSLNVILNRCLNRVTDPFEFTGYSYQYEERK